MYCQKCGALLEENAKFCGGCGSQIRPFTSDENNNGNFNSMQHNYSVPVEKISKKEYLSTKCSDKCKKLIKASWTVWIISVCLTITLTAVSLTNSFAKTSTGGVYFNDQEVEAPTVENYGIGEVFKMLGESDPVMVTFVLISLVIILISVVLTITFGGLACKTKSTPLAVAFLVVSFFSALPTKLFDVIAAICILIFNLNINKEYKRYISEQIQQYQF